MSAGPSFRVEQLAAEAELSVDTIRYYQGLGLLPPTTREGRTARYGPEHLGRLRAIRALADDGFKLAQIKRLLADDHAARMAATLDSDYGPLVRVLIRALQRDPKARYHSAEDFGRALSALLPDPITARDEVVRFFEKVQALEEGRRRSNGAPLTNPPESQGSLLVEPSEPAEEEPETPIKLTDKQKAGLKYVGGFDSAHVGVSNFAFGDGSVKALSETMDFNVYQQLGHRNDGKLLQSDRF